ncbi:MAG: 4-hydroxy-3-methylbut-2-enyl diphosphate reductase [Pseudomonadota bacterium]|nr:4-hydroxy-3-methylbut-2-enyl diphosphate reductase [Pseudomonadota bacterium]
MQILMANPRGFCAGVDRAIAIVNRALETFGPPIYVRHEVVHNKYVVQDLQSRGAIFVEEVDEVPEDAILIFSAHGVSQAVRTMANDRGFKIFDATCPLVTKVHLEVARFAKDGYSCILIGHAGHPEVEGTMGQYDSQSGQIYLVENVEDVDKLDIDSPEKLAFVTQTTLSIDDTQVIVDALQKRYPQIIGPKKDDICYATQNRQDAVRILAEQSDVMIVVGSPNSSNSNRLRELAERCGTPAYLVDDPAQLSNTWFDNVRTIGVTAGASAPEQLIQQIIEQMKSFGATDMNELEGIEENISFSLPKGLRDADIEAMGQIPVVQMHSPQ